tara:strand:+ start:161 stop:607 length:447 start_codon:yes stop_codon:yes gene_type:complete
MGTATMAIVSAGMALKQGQLAKQAYANDAQAAYERAEEVAMQAEQKEIARKNQLNENLASLSSMFAGGGVSITGGSVSNLRTTEKKFAKDDITSIRYMGTSQSRQFKLAGDSKKKQGKAAQIGSYAKAAGSIGGVNDFGTKIKSEWSV